MEKLSELVKISSAVTPTAGAAATTDIEGTALDMSGFDSVLILVRMGAITTNAVTSIKAQHGDISTLSDAADIAGTSQTIADSDDEKTFYIDLKNVTKPYVRLYVDRGTQNAVVSSAHYIQYNARSLPVSHGSNVSGESFVSAVSGTA